MYNLKILCKVISYNFVDFICIFYSLHYIKCISFFIVFYIIYHIIFYIIICIIKP